MRWPALLIATLAACGGDSSVELSPALETAEIAVSWSIQDLDGAPLTCAQAQAESVFVAVGGVPQEIECGNESSGVVVFSNLLPGPFGVVMILRGIGNSNLQEHLANIEAEAGMNTYSHDFVLDQTNARTGTLNVRWLLGGEVPDPACETFGADRVLIQSQAGSIRDLQAELPCLAGRFERLQVVQGRYELRFTLVDENRVRLPSGGVTQQNFQVNANQTTDSVVNFPLALPEQASLQFEWTVNGGLAADECDAAGGQQIQMELFQQRSDVEEISIATATAACDAGQLIERDIPASANPAERRFRVSADLRNFLGQVLTSTTVSDVILSRGRTSTVSVDLQVQ